MKLKKCVCGVLFCAVALTSFPSVAFAMNINNTDNLTNDEMSVVLEPYQEVIDEINDKYNASITIQDTNSAEVYDNVKDMSVDEFKEKTEAAYLEAINADQEVVIYADDTATTDANLSDDEYLIEDTNGTSNNQASTIPNASTPSLIKLKDSNNAVTRSTTLFENVYQYYEWSQGKVYIKSNIAGDSGLSSLYYTSILARGTVVSVSKTHFRSSGSDVSLMDSSKTCYVKYTGRLFSAEGVDLLVPMTVKVYYFAAGGSGSGEVA